MAVAGRQALLLDRGDHPALQLLDEQPQVAHGLAVGPADAGDPPGQVDHPGRDGHQQQREQAGGERGPAGGRGHRDARADHDGQQHPGNLPAGEPENGPDQLLELGFHPSDRPARRPEFA
jgi:hypothetical protein